MSSINHNINYCLIIICHFFSADDIIPLVNNNPIRGPFLGEPRRAGQVRRPRDREKAPEPERVVGEIHEHREPLGWGRPRGRGRARGRGRPRGRGRARGRGRGIYMVQVHQARNSSEQSSDDNAEQVVGVRGRRLRDHPRAALQGRGRIGVVRERDGRGRAMVQAREAQFANNDSDVSSDSDDEQLAVGGVRGHPERGRGNQGGARLLLNEHESTSEDSDVALAEADIIITDGSDNSENENDIIQELV